MKSVRNSFLNHVIIYTVSAFSFLGRGAQTLRLGNLPGFRVDSESKNMGRGNP